MQQQELFRILDFLETGRFVEASGLLQYALKLSPDLADELVAELRDGILTCPKLPLLGAEERNASCMFGIN